MSSRYSIIQYVPDPIADERINVGVLAFDDREVRVRFLHNWERVRAFSGENLDFIQDFAERMQKSAESGLLFPGDQKTDWPKHQRLEKIAQSWGNSIQFTEPRGSLKDLEQVFEDAIKKFLVDLAPAQPKSRDRQVVARLVIPRSQRKSRDRQAVARLVISQVKQVLEELMGNRILAKEKYIIAGSRQEHNVDIAVANGYPYLAVQGISFEVHPPENLLNALAWTIKDIKDNNPSFPLAVVVLPPQDEDLEKIYLDTTKTYTDLGAKVLPEQKIKPWVADQLHRQDDLSTKISDFQLLRSEKLLT